MSDHEPVLEKETSGAHASVEGGLFGDTQVVAQLLNTAQIGVWRFDPDTMTYYFSSELDLGYEQGVAEVPIETLKLVQHPADMAKDDEIRIRITTEGGEGETEMRYRHADGHWLHLKVLYRAGKRLPSGKYEMYGISQNITEVAEARDEARAATEAKSTFLASVSHEIRTPLNGVTGVLHLLKNDDLSPESRRLVEIAINSGEMLAQLINDILDFSKIEAGKLEIDPVPTDLGAVAGGVVEMLRPVAESKGLELNCETPANAGWALVDPVRVRQCLFNIAGNAIKFTAEGDVTIRMSLSRAAEDQRLRVEVEDTGIGIPAEAKEKLFDRFQQAESGTTRKFGGTGLGLAISRALARQMGGEMDFDSTPGKGSTFWFDIAAPACEPEVSNTTLQDMDAPLRGLKVLVVDDNHTNRLVAGLTLESMGAEIVSAESGKAAIEAVGKGAFDLIFMDINMPEMDGLEATQKIRELSDEAAAIPVIALTADVMKHQREKYLAAGMDGVAPKPFTPAQLLTEIGRLADAGSAD